MSVKRVQKLNELIRHALGQAFVTELNIPPGVLATITRVTVSPDLSYADITVSVLPTAAQVATQAHLAAHAGSLRAHLARTLIIRKMPLLRFHIDHSSEAVEEIDALIDKIHREE